MMAKAKGRVVGTKNFFGLPRTQTEHPEPSETVVSDGDLADINKIMARFHHEGTGILDLADAQFRDVSEIGDYHDVKLELAKGNEYFMSLPSKVREIFGHSVEVFLDTAHDDDKRAKLVEAGFIEDVAVVAAAAAAPAASEKAEAGATEGASE